MTQVDLAFRQPTEPVSMNQAKGQHWAPLKRSLDPWKQAAWAGANNHRVTTTRLSRMPLWRPKPITVQVVIQFRSHRTRDPHNYTSTVVKAIVDGLVQAKIVPEDDARWVTVLDPILETQPDKAKPLTCTIRIRPREMFTHGD